MDKQSVDMQSKNDTEETRIDILKKYAVYDKTPMESYKAEYILGGEIPSILEKYGFAEYIESLDASSDSFVFKILDFVCDHFGHDGRLPLPSGRKIQDIIEFCENHDGKINCRGLAVLLASLLRLCSIKAQHITCMPFEEPFDDCHVAVDCLLPSGKRILLDPSFRLFLKDADGEYISLEHLRKLLIADQPIFANENASHNMEGFDIEFYRDYMTKNTLRFSRGTLYADGCDDTLCADGFDSCNALRIELLPAGYPAETLKRSEK